VTAAAALTIPVPAASASDDPHQAMAENYSSLAAAMMSMYAEQSDQTLEQYLSNQQVMLVPSQLPGTSLPADIDTDPDAPGLPTAAELGSMASALDPASGLLDVSAMTAGSGLLLSAEQAAALGQASAQPLRATDVTSLSKELSKAGLALDTSGMKSINQLAAAVGRSAKTADGAVTLAAATWASELAALNVPQLRTPGAPNVSAPTVPADALGLGLLMNKSLTRLVSDHPDLVAQAQKNGLGNKDIVKAWNSSMAKAYAGSSGSLNSL